jgi:hypothetical protein
MLGVHSASRSSEPQTGLGRRQNDLVHRFEFMTFSSWPIGGDGRTECDLFLMREWRTTMRRRVRDLLVPGLLVMLTALVRAGDVPKSADHPLIKRYEGSTIIQYSQKAFDAYRLVVGPDLGKGPKTLTAEGRVTRITYLVPEGRSTLEVIRNYELELKKAGFTTLSAGAQFHSASAGVGDISMPSTSPGNSVCSPRGTLGISPHS